MKLYKTTIYQTVIDWSIKNDRPITEYNNITRNGPVFSTIENAKNYCEETIKSMILTRIERRIEMNKEPSLHAVYAEIVETELDSYDTGVELTFTAPYNTPKYDKMKWMLFDPNDDYFDCLDE